MTHVLIRQCPICPAISALTDHLFASFRNDPNVVVMRIPGDLDDFSVEVDGEMIPTWLSPRFLRSGEDLVASIRRTIAEAVAV